jgi:hypothetical protein
LVALIVLSLGLRDLPFREAQSFGRNQVGNVTMNPVREASPGVDAPFAVKFGVVAILFIMFGLLVSLLTPEWRKRLIRIVIRVGVTYWALYILFTRYRDVLADLALNLNGLNNGSSTAAGNTTEPPAFASAQTISMASYIVSFGLALLLIVLAWKVYGFWKEFKESNPGMPLKKIARIARSSLDDLSSGRNSTDVILNCYFRMSDVIADTKKMRRKAFITPAEFALQLEEAGLPADPVKQLTKLFETVRYGGHRSNPKDVNEAVSCLTTILNHCGETV